MRAINTISSTHRTGLLATPRVAELGDRGHEVMLPSSTIGRVVIRDAGLKVAADVHSRPARNHRRARQRQNLIMYAMLPGLVPRTKKLTDPRMRMREKGEEEQIRRYPRLVPRSSSPHTPPSDPFSIFLVLPSSIVAPLRYTFLISPPPMSFSSPLCLIIPHTLPSFVLLPPLRSSFLILPPYSAPFPFWRWMTRSGER